MEKLLTYQELSNWLNKPIGTLRKWVEFRKIPFIKLPGGIRFNRQQIEDWIEARTTPVHKTWKEGR